LAGLVCPAQKDPDRLPDSVVTTVEELPPQTLSDTVLATSRRIRKELSDATPQNEDTAAAVGPAVLRTIPDSTAIRLKRDKEFAYANDPEYWKNDEVKKDRKGDNGFLLFLARLLSSKGFAYFIYMLLGAILLFALYKIIAENNLRIFYRRPAKPAAAEEEAGEWQEENLEEKLQRALQDKDHRMATRYLYLKMLRQLEDARLIQYQTKATGQDYVAQMSDHPQGGVFRFLNAAYERVWYGEFPVDQHQFDKLYGYFQDFSKSTGYPAT
jgi:hypothetical protein